MAGVPDTRRRASHSLEAVLSEAIALLDEAGEPALTFRALAARLGGGVGSIYWYVTSKEQLLDRAADHVVGGVLARTDDLPGEDPIADVRTIAVALFDAIADHPWLGAHFMRNTDIQPHALLLFERTGQQVLRLGLSPKQSLDAVSAVIGYVVGIAADLGEQHVRAAALEGAVTRDEFLEQYADQWRALDSDEFPFIHTIVDEFARHDDRQQFAAGLDLLLEGLRLQARR